MKYRHGIFLGLLHFAAVPGHAQAVADISVQASVADHANIESVEPVRLTLSRALKPEERIIVFLEKTDITDLFLTNPAGDVLTYQPGLMPLPVGESAFVVILVPEDQKWQKLARFAVKIRPKGAFETVKIKPTLDLNMKVQHFDNRYPDPPTQPPRRTSFIDGDGRFRLETEHSKPAFAAQTEWDVQGFSYRSDALMFAEKGDHASRVDLASYRIRIRVYKNELSMGNVSFGDNSLLIDGFSSRGVAARIPFLNDRFDIGAAALNGQSIVGADNFSGLNRKQNQVHAARVGWNVLREKARLRVDLTGMEGSLLPLPLLHQAALTDAEKSRGWGVRVRGGDAKGRLDVDAGLARSRFNNPADALLSGGQDLVPLKEVEKGARYANAKLKLFEALSLSYAHQRADPQYKSVAASVRSDFVENRFEVSGEARGVNYQLSLGRSADNVDNVRSVMKNETRSKGVQGGVKLASLLGVKEERAFWYPSLNYAYDHTHQLGVYVPQNTSEVGPATAADVPNQVSRNQTAGAEWQSDRWGLNLGYSVNSVDNQQLSQETADFTTTGKTIKVNLKPKQNLNLGFDGGFRRTFSAGENKLSRTMNWGANADWSPFSKTSLSASYSWTRENDDPRTSESKTTTADFRLAQRFTVFARCTGQAFASYSQSLVKTIDSVSNSETHNNRWVVNSGISLSFF